MRCKRRHRMRVMKLPEISLTPLIDTALTLLIIFMVTAPMLQNSIKVRLPQAQSQMDGALPSHDTIVTVTKEGQVYLGERLVGLTQLPHELSQELLKTTSKVVTLKGDGDVSYDTIINVMDKIKQVEGVECVGLLVAQRPV